MTKVKARTTTKTNVIFLVIVLVSGTFALSLSLSSPSSLFIIGDVLAQEEYGYNNGYGYDYDYNSYNSEEYYPPSYESYDDYPPTDPPADIIVPIDFPTIQSAIDAADEGNVIKVLPGTYTEQLDITKSLTILGSGVKSTIIETPLPLGDLKRTIIGLPYIINIDNQAQVPIKGFTIKGIDDINCDEILPITDRLLGIAVFDNAALNLESAIIKDCTYRSVFVGTLFGGGQSGHATITNTVITDYQNTGVFAIGSNSTLTMLYNKIIGSPSDVEVPVGIFFTLAKGTIINNEVSGNVCNIPNLCGHDWFTDVQAFGIDAAIGGEGSVIAKNYLTNNDIGIGVFEGSGCCIIDHNKLVDNLIFGIGIADGNHTVSNTKIFGGPVGVVAAATFFNTTATLDRVKIVDAEIPVQALSKGNLTAAVNVLSPSFFAP